MNKNQLNRFEMHNAVINYLNLHSEKWSSIPKIGTIKNEFGVIQEQIVNSKEAQQSAQVFVGQTKLALKSTIAQKTDILNDALEAFALIEGNSALENRMSSSYSDIYAMRNANFTTTVQEVILEADTNKEPLLTEYGVTEEQIEDLKIDLNQFLQLNGEPRAYRIASIQATKDLEQLFSDAHLLLTTKLDKVMNIFKRRDANFYNGYVAARSVVNH